VILTEKWDLGQALTKMFS